MQHADKAIAGFEKAFVARMVEEFGEGYRSSAEYLLIADTVIAKYARWAWQASRAELVVELPKMVAFEGAYDSLRSSEYSDHQGDLTDADEVFGLCRLIEAREAIEAAGVTVKE